MCTHKISYQCLTYYYFLRIRGKENLFTSLSLTFKDLGETYKDDMILTVPSRIWEDGSDEVRDGDVQCLLNFRVSILSPNEPRTMVIHLFL